MNAKTANLIAIELGILIAILAWLAFSNRPAIKPQAVAEEPARRAGSFATVRPALKSRNQPRDIVDYRADDVEGQNEEQTPAVQPYDQEVAPESPASSDLNDGFITESAPSYAVLDAAPVVYPPDYLLSPLDQIAFCPQPNQIIVFSNNRSSGRGRQSRPRNRGGRRMVMHQRPAGRQLHPRGGGVVSRRNPNARPSQTIPAPLRSLARK